MAVIIATIIEMILPKNNNKKYIQMVIGVYVLFNIISPIIKNKEIFTIEKYNVEDYQSPVNNKVDQSSMDKRIEKIYLEELKNKVISKFEENGVKVSKCEIDAVLDTSQKNAGIHLISVKIKDEVDNTQLENIKRDLIKDFEIDEKKLVIK